MIEFRLAASDWIPLADNTVEAEALPVLVGLSAAIERLRRDVLRAAPRHQPVLIVGEPGSGKSLIARALHEQGPRAKEGCGFVACRAIPGALLEVELFGSGAGAADRVASGRQGLLRSAGRGTVILGHVDALSEPTRASLAAFVSNQRLRLAEATGAAESRAPRIVATCAVDATSATRIHTEIAAALGASMIHVPSLRERRADIPLLVQFFAAACEMGDHRAVFSAAAMSALTTYSWPGNVRQLRTVVERLVTSAGAGEIEPNQLPVGIRPRPHRVAGVVSRDPSVGEALFTRVQSSGESFWSSVYPLFMKREITRADLRDLIRRASEATRGDLDDLVRVLNMPRADGRRFIRFLRKYDCELVG